MQPPALVHQQQPWNEDDGRQNSKLEIPGFCHFLSLL